MAVSKKTLHPLGDNNTDIYPKTSIDQVVGDRPTSRLNGSFPIGDLSGSIHSLDLDIEDSGDDDDKGVYVIAKLKLSNGSLQRADYFNLDKIFIPEQSAVISNNTITDDYTKNRVASGLPIQINGKIFYLFQTWVSSGTTYRLYSTALATEGIIGYVIALSNWNITPDSE